MTREEAAEVILGEPAFKPCAECDGLGFLIDSNSVDCAACARDTTVGGSGKVYNPRYVTACAVLGMDVPEATWDDKWFVKWHKIRMERQDAERSSNRAGEEDGQEGRPPDDRPQPIR